MRTRSQTTTGCQIKTRSQTQTKNDAATPAISQRKPAAATAGRRAARNDPPAYSEAGNPVCLQPNAVNKQDIEKKLLETTLKKLHAGFDESATVVRSKELNEISNWIAQ